jgi:hypothetical protein
MICTLDIRLNPQLLHRAERSTTSSSTLPQHINKLLHGDNSDVSAPTIQNDVIISY